MIVLDHRHYILLGMFLLVAFWIGMTIRDLKKVGQIKLWQIHKDQK